MISNEFFHKSTENSACANYDMKIFKLEKPEKLKLLNFFLSIFLLAPAILNNQSLALTLSDECNVSSDVEFFDLTAYTVEPYVPSLDENGVPYLKGADLANAEINHYRKQYESAPLVRLSMDRYASLTANSSDAFKNFESRIIVIDPECNELKLFFGNLIGKSVVDHTTYLEMYEAANRLDHPELTNFIEQRVKLKPKNIDDIIKILKSDLAFDPTLIKSTLTVDFLNDLNLSGKNHHVLGGELALLSYAKKGGSAIFPDGKIELLFVMPESRRGLADDDKMLVILSDGSAHFIPDLNFKLARYSLEQLGVPTSVLKVKQIHNGQKFLCQIDEVGHWYRVVKGSRIRECNFNQVLIQSIQNGGWVTTFDENTSPISFGKIRDIFIEHGAINVSE